MLRNLHWLLADTYQNIQLTRCGGLQNTFVGPAMSLFAIIMVLLLVSRGVFVFPILAAHNYFSKEKLPFRQMVVAWCAHIFSSTYAACLCSMFCTESLSLHMFPCYSCIIKSTMDKSMAKQQYTHGHRAKVIQYPPNASKVHCVLCDRKSKSSGCHKWCACMQVGGCNERGCVSGAGVPVL